MEPVSIATTIAGYLLSEATLRAIGQGMLGERVDSVVCTLARQSVRPAQALYRRLKEQESRGQVPANHDVERGIYQAYLQASLAVVVAELGVLGVKPPRARWQMFRRRPTLAVSAYPYAAWLERTYLHLQEEYDRMQSDTNQLPPTLVVRPGEVDDASDPTVSEVPGAVAVLAADLNVLLAPPTQVAEDDTLQARIETIRAALTDLVERILIAKAAPPSNFALQFRTRLRNEWYSLFAAFFAEASKTTPRLCVALHQHYFAEIREALRHSGERDADLRELLVRLPTADTLAETFEARLYADSEATRARLDALAEQLRTAGLRREEMLEKLGRSVETLTPLLQSLADGQSIQQTALAAIQATLNQQRYGANEARERVTQRFAKLTRTFAGRADELRALDDFLEERSHGILLVYGPAGAGKSTLVANWIASYEQRHPDTDVRPRFVYHAFSQEVGTTDRTDAYVHLLRQVQETAPRDDDADTPPAWGTYANERKALEDLRDLIRAEGASPDAPLVLVVDALDEADGMDPGKRLELPVPYALPPHVYLVASVRDTTPSPLLHYLTEWEKRADVSLFTKPSLPPEAIADWLRQSAQQAVHALADEPGIPERLFEVSEQGYPLYLSFLIPDLEDAAEHGAPLPDLLDQTPRDFEDYFERAIGELDASEALDDRIVDLFALVAVAFGPIEVSAVQALPATRRFRASMLSPRMRRWISVLRRDGHGEVLSFAHPRLAQVVRMRFSGAIDDAEAALLRHCLAWTTNGCPYALRSVADHLSRAYQASGSAAYRDALYALARDKTYSRAVAQRLPTAFDLRLRTLSRALDVATQEESAPDIAEFMLAHGAAVEELRSRPPRRVWLETRSLDAALAAAAHLMPSTLGTFEYLALAWTLQQHEHPDEAEEVLRVLTQDLSPNLGKAHTQFAPWMLAELVFSPQAHELALRWLGESDLTLFASLLIRVGRFDEARTIGERITDESLRAEVLSALAVALAQAGRLNEARTAAEPITDEYSRGKALVVLAHALAQAGRFEDARAAAKSITTDRFRAEALSALAQSIAQAGDFDEARITAEHITDEDYRAQALSENAIILAQALAKAGQLDEARATAEHIYHKYSRDKALIFLSQTLAQTGHLDEACFTAESITNEIYRYCKAKVLSALAVALAQAGRLDEAQTLFGRALATAESVIYFVDRAIVLAQAQLLLVQALAGAGRFDEAHATAESIEFDFFRAEAMSAFAQALAQDGLIDEARAIAESATEKPTRAKVLCALAQTLAWAGRFEEAWPLFDEARSTAESITFESSRARVLDALAKPLAQALTQAGRLDEAWATAERITDICTRAEVMSDLTEVHALPRRFDEIQTIFDDARAAARFTAHGFSGNEALSALAVALTQAGRFDEARATAERIICPFSQARALRALAQSLAGARRFEEAHATAKRIKPTHARDNALSALAQARAQTLAQAGRLDEARAITVEFSRAHALSALAQALAQAGRLDEVQTLFDEARVEPITSEPYRAMVRARTQAEGQIVLAQALARAGHLNEARATAERITNDYYRPEALGNLAYALAQAGRLDEAQNLFDEAHATAERITDDYYRAEALSALTYALARAGHLDDARTIARQLNDSDETLAKVYHDHAQALAQAGRLEEARATAERITNDYYRAEALGNLAYALAQAGRLDEAQNLFDEAHATAERITDDYYRAKALSNHAKALAQAGRLDEARATAERITNDGYRAEARSALRAEALSALTYALARAGHLNEARATAERITNDYYRPEALGNLAYALAQAGRLDEAQNLFDEARSTAERITGDNSRASVQIALAEVLTKAGRLDEAQNLFDEALASAKRLTNDYFGAELLSPAQALALAKAGRLEEAQSISTWITHNLETWLARLARSFSEVASSQPLLAFAPLFARYPSVALEALPALITFYPDQAPAIMERTAPYLPQ